MTTLLDVRIQGDSMWPTFHDGQILTFCEIDEAATLEVGDVVLAHHPLKKDVLMVKRIHRIEPDGRLFLTGDQPDPTSSEDSHNFGPVAQSNIMAKWTG
ncbi:MAG: S26 family signal peptidase [Candidatus Poseidonia sp.]|nr:S26 family signal peptidase [Poseidonia sp.]